MMARLKNFLYANRDIALFIAIFAFVRWFDLVKAVFARFWFLVIAIIAVCLFLLRKRLRKMMKYLVFEIGPTLLTVGIIVFLIMTFLIQPFKIPTGSMRMTLLEGDIIFVNKFLYGAKFPFTNLRTPALRQPERGDVIVFIFPLDRSKNYIKRLVGIPGDTIQIKDKRVYVNEKPLEDSGFGERDYFNKGDFQDESKKVVVPKDSYFVLGDNSTSSQDSRFWGFVPKQNVLGKAILIYWPPNRIRIIR